MTEKAPRTRIEWEDVDFLLAVGETLPAIAQRLGYDEPRFLEAYDRRYHRAKEAR